MVCYIRYRKCRPELHEKSTFKMPGGIWMSYVILAFMLFALIILSLEPDTLKALKISPLWVIILAVTYQILYKTWPIKSIYNYDNMSEKEELHRCELNEIYLSTMYVKKSVFKAVYLADAWSLFDFGSRLVRD